MNTNRGVWFLVILATVFLTLIYFLWYWIAPISAAFVTGRFLFLIYLLVVLFWIFVRGKKSPLVGSLVLLLFLISFVYYQNFMSTLLDKFEHDGERYYLTYSREPFDGWQDYEITLRKGLFTYHSHGLGMVTITDNLKLKYDSTISKMTVVETGERTGREIIVSIEEENPLFYEAHQELDSRLYYLFSSCRQIGVDCQNSIYSLYKCKLDNTYCERLPFMYNGKYSGYSAELVGHEDTSEIEVFFEAYLNDENGFGEVLIYSYGREPHCHVEDCHILETP